MHRVGDRPQEPDRVLSGRDGRFFREDMSLPFDDAGFGP